MGQVTAVEPKGQAAVAGVRVGWIITAVEGFGPVDTEAEFKVRPRCNNFFFYFFFTGVDGEGASTLEVAAWLGLRRVAPFHSLGPVSKTWEEGDYF